MKWHGNDRGDGGPDSSGSDRLQKPTTLVPFIFQKPTGLRSGRGGCTYSRTGSEKQRFAFVRTEPCLVDVDGRIFWKFKSYNNGEDLVLQDMGVRDAVAPKEEWFVYGAETKEEIDQYCSFMRRKKLRSRTVSQTPTVPRESDEDNM